METKTNYKMPKAMFAMLWIFLFPTAMWVLIKTEKTPPIKILQHFYCFCAVWIIGIITISKICTWAGV